MAQTYIGTCGYDYLDWSGGFYPTSLARSDFLAYYATQFNALEIDYSFYCLPTAAQLAAIQERSGSNLIFSIKSPGCITHTIDPGSVGAAFKQFKLALEPLMSSGRLKAILFQFPVRFHYEVAQRKYLDRVLKDFAAYPCVVEFRNIDWINDRVIKALRERNAAFCCVDLPPNAKLPPSLDLVTTNRAYVRFHGRNAAAWWGPDAAARHTYLYQEAELTPWIVRLQTVLATAEIVMIFFNNCPGAGATQNAARFRDLLEKVALHG